MPACMDKTRCHICELNVNIKNVHTKEVYICAVCREIITHIVRMETAVIFLLLFTFILSLSFALLISLVMKE
jgi:hypothetical protein